MDVPKDPECSAYLDARLMWALLREVTDRYPPALWPETVARQGTLGDLSPHPVIPHDAMP
ncbi:MAG: hypothetical protein ACK5MT_03105 [Actinomycetales bacterium]